MFFPEKKKQSHQKNQNKQKNPTKIKTPLERISLLTNLGKVWPKILTLKIEACFLKILLWYPFLAFAKQNLLLFTAESHLEF